MADSKNTKRGPAAEEAVVHATATPPYTVTDVHIDPQDDEATPPSPVTPPGTSVVGAPPAQQPHNPAQWMHERLVHQIIEFEKGLGSEPLHITNLASWGPDMILFIGQFPDGRKFELIQHYSQVSVLLVAVPKATDEEPRRIGFELLKNFRDQPQPWGDPIS